MIINRGDIFLADLNPAKGKEMSKTRPVLVISNDINNIYSDTITVLPISSFKKGKVFSFEVFLDSKDSCLPKDSLIKANQIRTISKVRMVQKKGTINENIMEQAEKAVCVHLGIDLN